MDDRVTALDLAPAGDLSSDTKAYFAKCEEKLGLVPNALLSYAFDEKKRRDAGFTDRDIWDIASTAAFFNMSNRVAAAIDMRPNAEYHAMAR
ncbi:hypothetical protein [Mesorhizobium sp. CAU 1732]|uniref:hypothetical protein n=1 Tax=Mesorhizobium sp. CAU 1732 TaxID=3140358 RepID=UPI0032602A0B